MGAIISIADLTLGATLSGGSWQVARSLSKLQDTLLSEKARSSDATAASSTILVDLGSAKAIRCLGVLSHNIQYTGTVRVRGYSDSGYTTLVTGADTTATYVWPQTLTEEQCADYPDSWIYCFSSSKTARYWKVEITDTTNVQGFIELGRLFIGEVYLAPDVTLSYGVGMVYESRDNIIETIGGAIYSDSKQSRRIETGSFEALNTTSDSNKALIMQKILGKSGELLYIRDSSYSPEQMILYSFLATMRSVSPVVAAMYGANTLPIEFVEILDNSNITYLYGGSAADVLARQ